VTNTGVPPEVVESVYHEAHEFFKLPEEEKMSLGITEGSRWYGYEPLFSQKPDKHGVSRDFKEVFAMAQPEYDRPCGNPGPLHAPVPWPRSLPTLKPAACTYMHEMMELINRLNAIIEKALGIETGFFEPHFKHPLVTMRFFNYHGHDKATIEDDWNTGVSSCGAHTDFGHVTFIPADTVAGLQVFHNGDWYNINNAPGAILVNVGDILELWSGGKFKAPVHRVITKKVRLSVVTFIYPDWDATIQAPSQLCVEGNAKPPIKCYEHYLQRRASIH